MIPYVPMGSIGIDIDDTITASPDDFRELARATRRAGYGVHIVSTRSPSAMAESEKELAQLGIHYDEIHLLEGFGTQMQRCPHAGLDWYRRYLWQKVEYAMARNLTAFFDDDPRVLQLFRSYAPQILLNPGWQPRAR